MIEALEQALKRLHYILTITYDIRIAAEVHLAIDEINGALAIARLRKDLN